MDLLATFVLSQLIAATLCAVAAAIVLPDENSLLQEIRKIVDEAIRDLRGNNTPNVVDPVPMPAARNAAGRSEQEIQKFNARLQAYGSVSSAWIVESCELTDEQQIKLKRIRKIPTVNTKGYPGRCLCFSRCPADQGQTFQNRSSRPSKKIC